MMDDGWLLVLVLSSEQSTRAECQQFEDFLRLEDGSLILDLFKTFEKGTVEKKPYTEQFVFR